MKMEEEYSLQSLPEKPRFSAMALTIFFSRFKRSLQTVRTAPTAGGEKKQDTRTSRRCANCLKTMEV